MKKQLVAALACRNNGTRLYGKPLQNLDVENNVCILEHMIDVIRKLDFVHDVVLGISEGNHNLAFVDFAKAKRVKYIMGPESSVLARLISCGEAAEATDILRATTESPFMNFQAIESAWHTHTLEDLDATVLDFVPDGTNVEILSLAALKRSYVEGEDRHRAEHCSQFIRENKEKFRFKKMDVPKDWQRADLRLTVDTPEDLILCRAVYKHFRSQLPLIPLTEIIAFLDSRPDLTELVAPLVPNGMKTMYL